MYQRICLTIAIIGAAVSFAFADTGDIRHIISHNKTKVVTDPTKGVNDYPNWVLFPSKDVSYRRILLNITYQCPDSQHCGEWDYVDNVFLRRIGSVDNPPVNFEIARTISPYGWRFGPTWHFTWSVDITDFAILLRDSVEVVFEHGGVKVGLEVSFQVTTNSVIERKAALAKDRQSLMHQHGHHIAYVVDGAGNFQRASAVGTLCKFSDCTVAYSESEMDVLAAFIVEKLDA